MSESKHDLPEVVALRTWKEYVGESLLIVFSVVLALILTEIINRVHENNQTREVLHELREELIENKHGEERQYKYHLQVLKNIDSALHDNDFLKKVLDSGRIHLHLIAPDGVLLEDLNDVSWQVAKQYNIFTKVDLKTFSLLTNIYNHQQRITKTEDEIGKVLLSFESRMPENARTTLILMRDNYHGWAVDRAPALLEKYQKAIDELSNY
jgi:hypothetical protein